jgi:hypothetical protein
MRLCFLAVTVVCLVTLFPGRSDAKSCVVSDPTDRALNVRETPNGRVINRLRNGRTVEITQFENDAKGRPWGYATGYYKGRFRNWGWVFMAAVACDGAQDISQVDGKSCVVADPVDPTLNVRATPNGELINRLRNGRKIKITEIRNDTQGRPWGYAVGNYQGQFRKWGWVFLKMLIVQVRSLTGQSPQIPVALSHQSHHRLKSKSESRARSSSRTSMHGWA